MSAPSMASVRFLPEPLPAKYASSQYRAFRAVLPYLTISGTVKSIVLTPEGKLAIVGAPDEQIEFIPKKDASDLSESHLVLVPGGTISAELIQGT